MKKGIYILCLVLLSGCFDSKVSDVIVRASDHAYLCEDYIVEEGSNYTSDTKLRYRLKIIQIKSSAEETTVDFIKGTQRINNLFNKYNYFYELSAFRHEVHPQLRSKSVNHRDLLKSYWELEGYSYVTIIILPDHISVYNNPNIGGAALGISQIKDVSAGKPICFVKRSNFMNEVVGHELGHAVNSLMHPHQGNSFTHTEFSCGNSDLVSDTRIIPMGSSFSWDGLSCDFIEPEGYPYELTEEDRTSMATNIMNYTLPECMSTFTKGQLERSRYLGSINPLLKAAEIKDVLLDIYVSED